MPNKLDELRRLDELRPFWNWVAARWVPNGTVSCVMAMLGGKYRLHTECDEVGSRNEY